MKSVPQPISFEAWRKVATQNLPYHLNLSITNELSCHYQDAYQSYLSKGLSSEKAIETALADLGDPSIVNKQFLTTFISRRRLFGTIAACASYFFVLLIFPILMKLMGDLVSYVVQDFFSTLVLIFILSSFIRLIGIKIHSLHRPSGLLMVSLMLGTIIRFGFLFFFNTLPFSGSDPVFSLGTNSMTETIWHAGFVVIELLAGFASTWLGWRLFRINQSLYGLLPTIRIVFVLIGFFAAGVAVSLVLNSIVAASLFSALGYSMVTILLSLMILLFYRASFWKSDYQIKTIE